MNVGRLIFICVGRPTSWIQAGLVHVLPQAGRMNVGVLYFFCVDGRLRGIQAGLHTRAAGRAA
jgi:hypothetical protein